MQQISEKEPRMYEIALLLPEEGSYDEVKGLITQAGATIDAEGTPKRIQLAYPIQKATHGVFTHVHVTMIPDAAKVIEQGMRNNQHILRSLVFVLPPKKEPKPKKQKKEKVVTPVAAETKMKKADAPLSNKDLEDTIKEMMG